MAESSYPYTAKDGTCRYNGRGTGVKASTNQMVTANSISAMKQAVSQQPISVLIEADRSVFSAYRSGVFNNSGCGTALDHAVSVVGYGSDGNQSYWIMRNSWGTTWGE
jgi:C1A family cysteine protease